MLNILHNSRYLVFLKHSSDSSLYRSENTSDGMINFKDCTVFGVIDEKDFTAIHRSSHLILLSILILFYNFYCLKGTRTTQLLIAY